MSKPHSRFRGALALLVALCCAGMLRAAEVIPPKPTRYFNDAAGIVSPAVAAQLNQRLEQFERDTSNQILVAIYPHLQSDSSVEDYTVRVAQAWGVGQKGRNNGAVLFAFMQEHQLRIQVGYGLEAVLPDGLCHLIVENELKPRFRAGDYAGGLDAAVTAIIAATRGEYHGTGRTSDEGRSNVGWPVILAGFLLFIVFGYVSRYRRSAVYQSSTGRRGLGSGPTFWLGGGGFGGGGSFGGGGGGFSGGGGSFGGGGAGGSW